MGQKKSYESALTDKQTAEFKPVYKKTEFPNDLLQELTPFISSIVNYLLKNITGFLFVYETKGVTFEKYQIFISDSHTETSKNEIFIDMLIGYYGSLGTDYSAVSNKDQVLEMKRFIDHVKVSPFTNRSTLTIDNITYKFIDEVKKYNPTLYKLLAWMKTGK